MSLSIATRGKLLEFAFDVHNILNYSSLWKMKVFLRLYKIRLKNGSSINLRENIFSVKIR